MEGGPCFTPFLVTEPVVSNVVVEYINVISAANDILEVDLGEIKLTCPGTVELCLLTGGMNLKVFLVVDLVVEDVVVVVLVVVVNADVSEVVGEVVGVGVEEVDVGKELP